MRLLLDHNELYLYSLSYDEMNFFKFLKIDGTVTEIGNKGILITNPTYQDIYKIGSISVNLITLRTI